MTKRDTASKARKAEALARLARKNTLAALEAAMSLRCALAAEDVPGEAKAREAVNILDSAVGSLGIAVRALRDTAAPTAPKESGR